MTTSDQIPEGIPKKRGSR